LAPTAHFIASDISEEMLAIAKAKLKDAAIEWGIIDAQDLPFDDDSLDLVVCCFGYMFVPDKVAAFAEARRVLRPGGSLLLTTWDTLEYNGASNVFRRTLKKYFGDTLPESYKLPFSMNDPEAIRNDLLQAGFLNVKAELIEKNSVCATAKEAAYGLVHGGSLYNEIIKRNESWLGEISATVEKELAEKYGAAPTVAPMRAILCQAVN
jgi:ubiquinone/menaquinone biosynthesis C-methylase UbiE